MKLNWPMRPYPHCLIPGSRDHRLGTDPQYWRPPNTKIAVPSIPYSGWSRGVLRRGRIVSGSHFRNGIWQPLLENREVRIYLTCITRGCRRIHSFGFGDESFDIWVESDGYHHGTCIHCDDCHQHFWCLFLGWEKLLELPIKEI